MLGIFCARKVSSNEDYRKYARRCCFAYAGLALAGMITAAIALAAEYLWEVAVSDMMLGVYTGVGTGLIVGGLILLFKNLYLLKNEKKLRQARIAGSDERNIQISALATKAALAVLLVGIYFAILVGGLWYPILAKALMFLVVLFMFSYVVAYKVISMKI